MNRRIFLMGSLAGATAAIRSSALPSPNDTIRIACVGLRGRGVAHLHEYPKIPNVEIAALCDVDESILAERLKDLGRITDKKPATYTDLRKLLEDKSIDAISIATPNHQHTLQTIWGCQAGKDVYVEKPCSYNMFEAQQIVAAARKYDRMVQHGANGRSSLALREAARRCTRASSATSTWPAAWVSSGATPSATLPSSPCLPACTTISGWGRRPSTSSPETVSTTTSTGSGITATATSATRASTRWTSARWRLGVKYPTKVSAIGGHYMFDDDQETPNTLMATFEFDEGGKKKMLDFEVRHWITNHEAGIGEPRPGHTSQAVDVRGMPTTEGDFNTIGNIVYGSKGYLTVGKRL